jgi:hypothetical protein
MYHLTVLEMIVSKSLEEFWIVIIHAPHYFLVVAKTMANVTIMMI